MVMLLVQWNLRINFFHYLVFFIERYKSMKWYYERFSLLREFIIGGSTVL